MQHPSMQNIFFTPNNVKIPRIPIKFAAYMHMRFTRTVFDTHPSDKIQQQPPPDFYVFHSIIRFIYFTALYIDGEITV